MTRGGWEGGGGRESKCVKGLQGCQVIAKDVNGWLGKGVKI